MRTRLRCSRCGKPICPDCMVSTPVGYRCPECAAGPRLGAYRTTNIAFLKAFVVGAVVALAIGFFWGNFPEWGFFMALLIGFGTVEAMARVSNYKRGGDLMAAAMGVIAIGIIVSRYTIAVVNPEGVPIELSVDMILTDYNQEIIQRIFYVRFIPDFLFMAIPFVIAYIRFR
jgi:hypothetical protein